MLKHVYKLNLGYHEWEANCKETDYLILLNVLFFICVTISSVPHFPPTLVPCHCLFFPSFMPVLTSTHIVFKIWLYDSISHKLFFAY